jgi:hypothetical protein
MHVSAIYNLKWGGANGRVVRCVVVELRPRQPFNQAPWPITSETTQAHCNDLVDEFGLPIRPGVKGWAHVKQTTWIICAKWRLDHDRWQWTVEVHGGAQCPQKMPLPPMPQCTDGTAEWSGHTWEVINDIEDHKLAMHTWLASMKSMEISLHTDAIFF